MLGLKFYRKTTLFGPAHIHPGQHICPVAGFGAACAGIDFKKRIVGVRFAIQQRLQLLGGCDLFQGLQRCLGLGHDLCIILGFAHRDQLDIIRQLGLYAIMCLQRVDQRLTVLHKLLRLVVIVPEGRIFDAGVELLQPVLRRLPAQALAEQFQRCLDLGGDRLDFGAHMWVSRWFGCVITQPRFAINTSRRNSWSRTWPFYPPFPSGRWMFSHPAPVRPRLRERVADRFPWQSRHRM